MGDFDYSTVPRKLEYPEEPVTALLTRAVEKFPDNVAIHFFGKNITYRQFDALVRRFMNVLRAVGVSKGDSVAIMAPNCPQGLIAYQAVLRVGGIVVQTNPLYVEREIQHQFNDAEVKTAVVLNLFARRVSNVLDKTSLKNIIVFRLQDYMGWPVSWLFPLKLRLQKQDTSYPDSAPFLDWNGLMAAAGADAEPADVSVDDTALYQYTGGTTGVAKGVILTHRNVMANAMQARTWFTDAVEGEEVIILTLPVFHAFGMTVGMNLAIALAAKIVAVPKFDPDMVMKLIEKHKVTMFPGVPAMYVAIINHPNAVKHDISSIKYCISGAAALASETREKFEKMTGGTLVEGYGLSEASPVTHCNPLQGGAKAGSIGMALPGTESKIVSEEGAELPPGEVGELVIRGPQVMKGYKGQPDENAKTLRDGWLFTGDMGSQDEDGFIFLMDRKKEMVISGGCNIYPKEIEEILYQIDGVLEAAVVGMPDERFGEKTVAAVVRQPGAELSEAGVIAACKKDLASYKVPKQVVFLNELPKTIIGKVLKRELKKVLEGKA